MEIEIEVRERGVEISGILRTYIERRLTFALGRFAGLIRKVVVRLQDMNGPKGGIDQQCQLAVALRSGGMFFVEAKDSGIYMSIARAADKAARRVVRRAGRSLDRRLPPKVQAA